MKVYNIGLTLMGAAAIAGCTVGPDYHPPVINAAKQWSEPLAGGETNHPVSIVTWWKSFDDKELDSLVARAVNSNLDLRIAQARVREARAQLGIANAEFYPTVDAGGSYSQVRIPENALARNTIPLPHGASWENNEYQTGFDASWELDVFGGKRRGTEAANADVSAAVFSQQDVQVTLVSEVARNYVTARGYQQRLAIAHQNIKSRQAALELSKDRFHNGLTTSLDAEQAATVLAQIEAQVPALENGLHESIHRLGVLLGQQPGALLMELGTEALIPIKPPSVPVGLPSDLLRRRPDIRSAERQWAAANAQIGVATAELFPKFYLTGAAGFESISTSTLFTAGSRYFDMGPTLQWRIFDAGRIRSNIRVQNARQEQALDVYQKTVLTSFEEVENALVAYAKEQARNVSLRHAVETSQHSLQLANQQYAAGLTTFINVLDAERSLYQAQDDLVQSDQSVTQNLIALYKALGGGWEAGSQPAPEDHRGSPAVAGSKAAGMFSTRS
jgi:multidrug efflux system outer membrane protein